MKNKWRIDELLKFSNQYRAKCTLILANKKIITLWTTLIKSGDKLSIKTPDNWIIESDDLKLELINELKYKIRETELYENK